MKHLTGFACCLGGLALYLLSRSSGRLLKSITRVHQLKDLEKLLEIESKLFPLAIAVSGRVGSETPIKCEHSDVLGVFIKKTAEQQVLRRNWMLSWVSDSTLMKPITKEVPWYLDDGTGRVNVAVSQGETGLALRVGSDVCEKSEPLSLVRGVLSYLKGFKIVGVRHIEHVVPVGTPLTVVGEAITDGMGSVQIQKPIQGPFAISYLPMDELIYKLGARSRKFKYASMGLIVLGVILLLNPVIEYILNKIEDILEIRRQQLILRRIADAAARRAEPVTREFERQHENSSDGASRNDDDVARRAEPVTREFERQHENSSDGASRNDDDVARRAEPVTREFRQHENSSDGASRNDDDVARRAEPVTREFERQHENSSDGASRNDDDVDRRAEPVTRELERQHESSSDGTSRGGDDLCVICYDQKYNSAFTECGHVCCCLTCSSRLRNCPICRERIEKVLRIYI